MLAEILLFLRSVPEIVKILGNINDSLQQLKRESINKELDSIKKDVSDTIKKIEVAQTSEERKRLSLELALRMSK